MLEKCAVGRIFSLGNIVSETISPSLIVPGTNMLNPQFDFILQNSNFICI